MEHLESKTMRRKRKHHEATTKRRSKATERMKELTSLLPLGTSELERVNQTSLLKMAASYIKLRHLVDQFDWMKGTLGEILLDQLAFCGFVMVVSLDGTVLFADDNITEQLGPNLVDVIGVSFKELLHPDDQRDLKDLLGISSDELTQSHVNRRCKFVLRMKTTLSALVRSEAKIQYKNIQVTCHLRQFEGYIQSSNSQNVQSMAAILLCRSENVIGIPEITISSSVKFTADFRKRVFCDMEMKGQWLLGYGQKEVVGKDVFTWRHPSEVPHMPDCEEKYGHFHSQVGRLMIKEGSLKFPLQRWLTGWGEWLIIKLEARPFLLDGEELLKSSLTVEILGVAKENNWSFVRPKWLLDLKKTLFKGNYTEVCDCFNAPKTEKYPSTCAKRSKTTRSSFDVSSSCSSQPIHNSEDPDTILSATSLPFSSPLTDNNHHSGFDPTIQHDTIPSFPSTSCILDSHVNVCSTYSNQQLEATSDPSNPFLPTALPLDISNGQPLLDGEFPSRLQQNGYYSSNPAVDRVSEDLEALGMSSCSSSSPSSSGYISERLIDFSALSTDTALPERSVITDDSAPTDNTQQRPPFSKMTSTEELLHSLMNI